ncbi:50S ribosomal protein L24 [Aporhodopirellula aestuarii]|uniref:Large ribosomal subunit protein uL24 n=1 Tax=Aporhodopirellula aestuarii TaxID=2950107 RepID=A0ABT0U2K6_9BACT|nr:50S ribosomal protein L24 [Aporhodopirellula aestuarii]MCM2371135.1 50S ribosomal protein L24 [Aporhodopirellula aestuarii]
MNFRIDDEVIVITGADKGHRGKIIKIDRDANKVIVEGAAKVWKHVRQSQKNPQGGRLNKEMPISASNVLIVDPSDGKPSRIGLRYLPDGSKERYAKRSGASLGQIAPAKASRASK